MLLVSPQKVVKDVLLLITASFFTGVLLFVENKTYAYGECSEYGFMATYDILTDSCKCMSGYVLDKDFSGQTTCVSGNGVCHDKYGYNSRYNSLNSSCECSYGYIFGKDSIGRTQCVSPDSLCTDQLGYNARYNSLYDKCECRSGYVISGGRCIDGDSTCRTKHGLYSSYDDLANNCECDNGYTFGDSNQCVKKQNNVYFTLKELDTDTKRAIIKDDYRYYLVTYNAGCYSSTFHRYINNQIVVNLGTDFDLDTWDKIVLQEDNESCDITRINRADSSTTLEPEEDETFSFIPQPSTNTSSQLLYETPAPLKVKKEFQFEETKKKDFDVKLFGELNVSGALRKCPSIIECDVLKYFDPKTRVDILGNYNNEEWYKVNVMDGNSPLSGWMHYSIIDKIQDQKVQPEPAAQTENAEVNTANEQTQKYTPWYRKFFSFFFSLFK